MRINAIELAEAFGLKSIRGGYIGRCPVCDYPDALFVREKQETVLWYCHASHCHWRAILDCYNQINGIPNHYPISVTQPVCNKEASTFHLQLWADSLPASGTLVEGYLKSRGIRMAIPDCIRYLPRAFHNPGGSCHPVMLARVERAGEARLTAVHRTFLACNGQGKAAIIPNKMMLGKTQGGAVRLAEPKDKLALTEGIETGLSVLQATGIPTWATLSCRGFQSVILPEQVQTVLLCADHDTPGIAAAEQAAERFVAQGLSVRICYPPQAGDDFNDLLQDIS